MTVCPLRIVRRGGSLLTAIPPQAQILANNTVASVKSPYFGAKDFAFALA